MANQQIINFDGLKADAAEKLASGMVESAKVRIQTIAQEAQKFSKVGLEEIAKVEKIFDALGGVAHGNCGFGC